MKLLREWYPLDYTPTTIKESRETNDGKIILSGILQKADTLNQNGRVYPRDILEREVINYQKIIQENRSTGELDHPESSVVSLQNVSHIIRDAYFDSDDVIGTVEVLGTPAGKILQELLNAGVRIGISSRGVGTTKRDSDRDVVQNDYQIICWDIVRDPSTPGAFISESVDPAQVRRFFTKTDRIDRIANEILLLKRN